jgi:hypothetical protein
MTQRNQDPDPRRNPEGPEGPPPESGMGGASDMGTHGRHPVSSPAMAREGRSPEPEAAPGDAPIERRRRQDPAYTGVERRIGRR